MAKKSKSEKGGKKGERGKSETIRRLKHRGSKHKKLETILKDAKTVSLDADDTMYDWTPVAEKVYNQVLAKHDQPPVKLSYVRNALKKYSPRKAFRFLGLSEAEAKIAGSEYKQAYAEHAGAYRVNKGTVELIHLLKNNGKKLAVVSNSESEYLESGLKKVAEEYNEKYETNESVASLFSRVVGAYRNSKNNKPSSAGLKKVKSELHIGDHQYDMEAADSAGIPAIGVLEGNAHSTEYDNLPDRLYPDMSSLAHAVDRLYNESGTTAEDKPGQYSSTLFALNKSKNYKAREDIPAGQHTTQLWNNAA